MISVFGDIFDICKKIIKDILGNFTFIHDFKFNSDQVRMKVGLKLGNLFSIAIDISIKNDVSAIMFYLNGKKFKIYLVNSKILFALKTALLFIKGIIFKDSIVIDRLREISFSEKEYEKLKRKRNKAKKIKKNKCSNKIKNNCLTIKLGKKDLFDDLFNENGVLI